jgi:hypothetical protein
MKKLVIALQLLFFASKFLPATTRESKTKRRLFRLRPGRRQWSLPEGGRPGDWGALTGVKVAIEGSDLKAYTDFDGVFRFENVKPGEYDVTATFVSYNRNEVQKFNPARDGNHLEIKMNSTL